MPLKIHGIRLVICALCATSSTMGVVVSIKGSPSSRSSNPNLILLSDSNDLVYTTNISINGNTFPVALDSGSSDLWVESAGVIPGAEATQHNVEIDYAMGSLTGDVEVGRVVIGEIEIPEQQFLRVDPANNHGTGVKGILGLGHSSLSDIFLEGNKSISAASLAQNIFLRNPNMPNFITARLGRVTGSSRSVSGTLSIGEVLEGMGDIIKAPKLDVVTSTGPERWVTLLDTEGITINGKPIWFGPTVTSGNDYIPHKQLKVLFDTGSSFSQVPAFIADQIYSTLPGAIKQSGGGADTSIYHLPCVTEVNITLSFGGIEFPVHPLDMSTGVNQINGMCLGTFQGIDPGFDEIDVIAGMSFLRNAYLLMNYGENVNGDPATVTGPFIQMLSTTNTSAMHGEFRQVRGNHTYTAPSHTSTLSSYVNTGESTHFYTTIPATVPSESPSAIAVSSSRSNAALRPTDRRAVTSIAVTSLAVAVVSSAACLLFS